MIDRISTLGELSSQADKVEAILTIDDIAAGQLLQQRVRRRTHLTSPGGLCSMSLAAALHLSSKLSSAILYWGVGSRSTEWTSDALTFTRHTHEPDTIPARAEPDNH